VVPCRSGNTTAAKSKKGEMHAIRLTRSAAESE
jgi:hypothetical protein